MVPERGFRGVKTRLSLTAWHRRRRHRADLRRALCQKIKTHYIW